MCFVNLCYQYSTGLREFLYFLPIWKERPAWSSQAGLSSGHIFSFISSLLFAKLGKCIRYELNLRSDDYLNRGLTGFHDTSYACRFNHLIIHCGNVFYFQSQSCDAGVKAWHVVLSAAALKYVCADSSDISL